MVKTQNGDQNRIYPSLRLQNFSLLLKGVLKNKFWVPSFRVEGFMVVILLKSLLKIFLLAKLSHDGYEKKI